MTRLTEFDKQTIAQITNWTKCAPTVSEHEDCFVLGVNTSQTESGIVAAIDAAVFGKFGKRCKRVEHVTAMSMYFVEYDAEEPRADVRNFELRDRNIAVGGVYCRTLKEVRAVQVRRDNEAELAAFTGGGTLVVPRGLGSALYSFATPAGVLMTAQEHAFIITRNGVQYEVVAPGVFATEWEPKDGTLQMFNSKYGKNIVARFQKLAEEYKELAEEITGGDVESIIDELADLNAVVFHMCGILGKTQSELLDMAVDKIVGREKDPNYKRKHPHGKEQI